MIYNTLNVLLLLIFTLSQVVFATNVVNPLRVDGLVTAVFTPFNDDFSLNLNQVEVQAAWLKDTGVEYVFVAGTTGESLKLNMTERMKLTETWLNLPASYGIKVIVHVGAESIDNAKALAAHAEAHGAVAIGNIVLCILFFPVLCQC